MGWRRTDKGPIRANPTTRLGIWCSPQGRTCLLHGIATVRGLRLTTKNWAFLTDWTNAEGLRCWNGDSATALYDSFNNPFRFVIIMAAEDYCTVADVRAYLGLSCERQHGPDDSTIASLITNSSRMIDAVRPTTILFTGERRWVFWYRIWPSASRRSPNVPSLPWQVLKLRITVRSRRSPSVLTEHLMTAISPIPMLESLLSITHSPKNCETESRFHTQRLLIGFNTGGSETGDNSPDLPSRNPSDIDWWELQRENQGVMETPLGRDGIRISWDAWLGESHEDNRCCRLCYQSSTGRYWSRIIEGFEWRFKIEAFLRPTLIRCQEPYWIQYAISRWDVESDCESKLADWEEAKDIPNCDSTHLWWIGYGDFRELWNWNRYDQPTIHANHPCLHQRAREFGTCSPNSNLRSTMALFQSSWVSRKPDWWLPLHHHRERIQPSPFKWAGTNCWSASNDDNCIGYRIDVSVELRWEE